MDNKTTLAEAKNMKILCSLFISDVLFVPNGNNSKMVEKGVDTSHTMKEKSLARTQSCVQAPKEISFFYQVCYNMFSNCFCAHLALLHSGYPPV